MKIVLGADICVTASNEKHFINGEMENVIDSELKEILDKSDYRVFNLEGPLTNEETPIVKCGPNLRMPEAAIKGLKALDISLLTLANNHIMDHGAVGFYKTIELLDEAGIDYVGAGNNLQESLKPFILKHDGIRIGVYACAEHEFTIADDQNPGANPYDPLESFDHISTLKKECDLLIVLFHGGKEYYRYPSPEIQRIFRKMAEKGADIVVAQHTHCIGCYEEYNGSTLVYGQGNFIFDNNSNEFWNSGLLLELDINANGYEIIYHPFVKKETGRISLAKGSEKSELMNGFHERSKQILNNEFVKNNYLEFGRGNFEVYLKAMHGDNFFFKVINKLIGGGFVFKQYSFPVAVKKMLNFIECEAHRELMITVLKNHNDRVWRK